MNIIAVKNLSWKSDYLHLQHNSLYFWKAKPPGLRGLSFLGQVLSHRQIRDKKTMESEVAWPGYDLNHEYHEAPS